MHATNEGIMPGFVTPEKTKGVVTVQGDNPQNTTNNSLDSRTDGPIQQLSQHPLSAAFPAMTDDEFQELRDSINIVGILNPITLLDDMVLDGWHRYTVALEYGMDCPMVELAEDVDLRDFVRGQNGARRNMTPSQTAFAVVKLYACIPPHRPNKSAVTAGLLKTTREIADIAGVGTRTIEQAKAVHAGAVPAVQDAVKAGTVSLETAAAVAKLPAVAQLAIAAAGPDAMRSAGKLKAKAAGQSGTNSKADTRIKSAKAEADTNQLAQDAYGDSDPVAMLEASEAENTELRALLASAMADDKQAEIIKFRRIADVATRRQNELMDTVNLREKELQRQANILRRIGHALGEDDYAKLPGLVEAMTAPEKHGAMADMGHR